MIESQTPTEEELLAIANAVARNASTVPATLQELKRAAIAKFPNFRSDAPGYQGPLYVIVWPAGPEVIDVITVGSAGRLIVNSVDDGEFESNVWGEDTDLPREDWRLDVQNFDTNLGYWDWVRSQREATSDVGGGICR